jgi:hypothetical protein
MEQSYEEIKFYGWVWLVSPLPFLVGFPFESRPVFLLLDFLVSVRFMAFFVAGSALESPFVPNSDLVPV